MVVFFAAIFLILAYCIHRPYNLGSMSNPILKRDKDGICIEVSGETVKPGIYNFHGPVTVNDAIERAGGLKDRLIVDTRLLSAALTSGDKIIAKRRSRRMGRVSIGRMAPKKLIILSIPMDINRATREELLAVPGLGPKLTLGIIDYRNRNGEFSVMEELKVVKGIGKVKYERIKDYIVTN